MPKPPPHVCPAAHSHLAAIAAIGASVQRIHADAHPDRFVPPHAGTIELFFRDQIDRDGVYLLVAENAQDVVVGYAFATIRDRDDNAFLSRRRTLSFEHLAVAEDALGTGAGGALIRAVEELARQVGADDIDLVVWAFNRHAIDVYEHAGYRALRQSMVLDL